MDVKWKFCKHVRYNEISFLMIGTSGRFCRVTIRRDYISQIVGIFDNEMTTDGQNTFIQRMIDVGTEITEKEFQEVQDFYAKNGANMIFGKLKPDTIQRLINKYNIGDKKPDVLVDFKGNYEMNF